MWRYIGNGDGYPGLPLADMSDEEMAQLTAEYESRFEPTHGKVADSGLWEHVDDVVVAEQEG